MLSFTRKEMKRNAAKYAKETLAKEGNRIKLSASVVICISLTMIMWLLSGLSDIVLDIFGVTNEYLYYPVSKLTLGFLVFFLVEPVYVGTFRMAIRMLQGEETEIADIFDTFSSFKAYVRAFRLSFKMFLRILPIIIVLRIHAIMEYLSYWLVFFDETVKAVNILFVPVALFLVLFACRSFGVVSFAYFDESVRLGKAKKVARKARKGNQKTVCALAYKTLFKLILSLLTLGIATVVHTIPLAMLNYGALACEMKQKIEIYPERTDI